MSNSTAAREAARQHDGKFGTQHRDAVDIPLDDQPTMTVMEDGTEMWRLPNGKRHRLDGPAVEWADGDREWYANGSLHRLDGPAVEQVDGTRAWYVNGSLHRLDGPARTWPNDTQEFWIGGRRYDTEADWRQAVEARTQTG